MVDGVDLVSVGYGRNQCFKLDPAHQIYLYASPQNKYMVDLRVDLIISGKYFITYFNSSAEISWRLVISVSGGSDFFYKLLCNRISRSFIWSNWTLCSHFIT